MGHDLLESLRRAHAEARMTGWDFSALEGRLIADDPWWDFEADCLDAMRYARAVADLGTDLPGLVARITARGFGHLINNTVREQAAKKLREQGRLPRHQEPRAHTDAP